MTTLTPEFIAQGLRLAPAEREKFANLLLESLDEPESDAGAWRAELRRRAELVASGNYTALTVEEVNAEVRRAVEEARAR